MRIAAVVPYWLDRPPMEALEVARAAESAECTEIWVGEMVTFDAFALAGAIARETDRIGIVCGPLPVGVRSPAALALGTASVTWLGGRPAHLALGASTPAVVSGFHGRPWEAHLATTAETVDVLRTLFAGERALHDGPRVRSMGFKVREPMPGAEIAVAAFGPAMTRLAARCADRVVVNILPPTACADVVEAVASEAEAAGRPAPGVTAWVPAASNPGEATLAQLRRQLAVYLGQPGYGEMFAKEGYADLVQRARSGARGRELADAIPDDFLRRVCALGDAGELRARLDEYARAGVETVAVVPATADDPGGEKVLHDVGSVSGDG